MYSPVVRATAMAWLGFFELCVFPLRAAAAPPGPSAADERVLQEEVWGELAQALRAAPITEPIFTDDVAARIREL